MTDCDPLTAEFATNFPDSFARVLGRASTKDISQVLGKLPPGVKASIVARLSGAQIRQLLDSGEHEPQQWLEDAPFDDAVTLLSRLPGEQRLTLVNALGNRERRQKLLRHEKYPTHSVGALVGDVGLRINSDSSAADVAQELRELGGDETTTIVVVDADGYYSGKLNYWRLLAGDPPMGKIRDYVRKVSPIYPETSIPSAALNEDWFNHNWLPVVDQKQRVLGAVSRARLIRAARTFKVEEQSAADVLLRLMTDSVSVLGALLDSVLTRRST